MGLGRKSCSPLLDYRPKDCAPGKTVAVNPGRNEQHRHFFSILYSFSLVLSGSFTAPYPPHASLSLTDITGAWERVWTMNNIYHFSTCHSITFHSCYGFSTVNCMKRMLKSQTEVVSYIGKLFNQESRNMAR